MVAWRNAFDRFSDVDGTTSVEYALLLALIGLAVIIGATHLGDALSAIFLYVIEQLPLS